MANCTYLTQKLGTILNNPSFTFTVDARHASAPWGPKAVAEWIKERNQTAASVATLEQKEDHDPFGITNTMLSWFGAKEPESAQVR